MSKDQGAITFVVTVPKLEGVQVSRWLEHIKDAVTCWGGAYPPDDPLFTANLQEAGGVEVRRVEILP